MLKASPLSLATTNQEHLFSPPISIQWNEGSNLCKKASKRKTGINIRNKQEKCSLFRNDLIVNMD